MFDQMVDSIRESSVKMLLTIEVREAGERPPSVRQVAKPTGEGYVPGKRRDPAQRAHPRASLSASSRSAATTPAPAAAARSTRSAAAESKVPEWLNEAATRAGVNYSQVLQEALMRKLNISR